MLLKFITKEFRFSWLISAGAILALFLLNILNPKIPALRCDGTKLLEPSISHKFRGDTINLSKLIFVVLIVPLIQVRINSFASWLCMYFVCVNTSKKLSSNLQIFITEWFYNRDSRNLYIYNPQETSRWKRTLIHASRWYRVSGKQYCFQPH